MIRVNLVGDLMISALCDLLMCVLNMSIYKPFCSLFSHLQSHQCLQIHSFYLQYSCRDIDWGYCGLTCNLTCYLLIS